VLPYLARKGDTNITKQTRQPILEGILNDLGIGFLYDIRSEIPIVKKK